LLPFYNTKEGKAIVEQFIMVNLRAYPKYLAELQGISKGAQVSQAHIFLLQFADELEAGWIPSTLSKPKPNCADIHVHTSNGVWIGHNEDTEPLIKTTAYIVEYDFTDSGEQFTAYTYPGRLPGDAWGFSKKSNLTFSMNWVGNTPVTVGLARAFVNRAIFGASSVADAIAKATPENRAFGFSLNLGDLSTAQTYNIEVAQEASSQLEIKRNFSHFNEYKVLHPSGMIPDESTVHRQNRCNEFPAPSSSMDIQNILGDTKDKQFPIYRTTRPSDEVDTAVSVVFDLVKLSANVWTTNPKMPSGLTLNLN